MIHCCRFSQEMLTPQHRAAAEARLAGPERPTGHRDRFRQADQCRGPVPTDSFQKQSRLPTEGLPPRPRRDPRPRPARRPPAAAEVRLAGPERPTTLRGQFRPVDPFLAIRLQHEPEHPAFRHPARLPLASPAFPLCLAPLQVVVAPLAVVALPVAREQAPAEPSWSKR